MSSSATTNLFISWPWPSTTLNGVTQQDQTVTSFDVQYKKGLGNWVDRGTVYDNSIEVLDIIDDIYSVRIRSINIYQNKSDWFELPTNAVVKNTGRSLNIGNKSTSELRNRAVPDSGTSIISVAGYYTPNDGGAANYYADTRDTTSLDNGGDVIVTASNSRFKLVTNLQTVRAANYGAIGVASISGATPDYTANIKRALAYAGSRTAGGYSLDLVIDPGLYKITDTLTIPSGVTLICNGILVNYKTNAIEPLIEGLAGSNCGRLSIDANSKIGARWAGNSQLEDIIVTNVNPTAGSNSYGLKLENANKSTSTYTTVTRCTLLSGDKALWIVDSRNINLSANSLNNPPVTTISGTFTPAVGTGISDYDRATPKAWVCFASTPSAANGAPVTITVYSSYNVTAIANGGAGFYGIGFINPFKNVNYGLTYGGKYDESAFDYNVPIGGFSRFLNSTDKRVDYCTVCVVGAGASPIVRYSAVNNFFAFWGE